jgi:hypothetical protein
MAKMNFSNVEEEVVTRAEFSLEKAREVLKNETIAVLGYGVQGPAQALNMRDNGVRVLVGVNRGGRSWEKALKDGWVPGETLFSLEEAAQRGTVIQYLISDAGQKLMWPKVKFCLKSGDALYFSHGFSIVYREQTGVIPPADVDVILVAPKGSGTSLRANFLSGSGGAGLYWQGVGKNFGAGDGHWFWILVCYVLQNGSIQRPDRRAGCVDGCASRDYGSPVQRTAEEWSFTFRGIQ